MKYTKDYKDISDYTLMEIMEELYKRKEEMLAEQELLLMESQDWSAAMAALLFEIKCRDMSLSSYWLYNGGWESERH